FLVSFQDPPNLTDFFPAKLLVFLQSGRREPKLRDRGVSLDVNVGWFPAVAGKKEEPIGADAKHRWHGVPTPRSRWPRSNCARRNRSCSTAPTGRAARAPCSARNPGRTPGRACRG